VNRFFFSGSEYERVDALRASIYPLTATFTPQPPLTRPLEATNPLDLALEALGTLAKLTSVTEITARKDPAQSKIPVHFEAPSLMRRAP
jgi:hypothetical protein